MTMKHLSPLEVTQFQQEIKTFYAKNRREMPWREPDSDGAYNPYHILVSEIMLQQTQVARVVPKYIDFITTYPSVQALAAAELSDVLKLNPIASPIPEIILGFPSCPFSSFSSRSLNMSKPSFVFTYPK